MWSVARSPDAVVDVDAALEMVVYTLSSCHKAFCKSHVDVTRWQRMGHVDQRSRCFGRRTDAESTGDVTGETVVATTGVARTTAARSIASAWQGTRCDRECTCEHPKSKKCIGKVHDLCAYPFCSRRGFVLCGSNDTFEDS